MRQTYQRRLALAAAAVALLWSTAGAADPFASERGYHRSIFQQVLPEPVTPQQPMPYASATDDPAASSTFRRQVVAYDSREAPGTIIIDTPNTALYYVLGNGRAIRYGIGVGREGFTWGGVQNITRKQEWPDWHPPADMLARQPYLPRFMAGGPGNPLGARAMYLGNTMYRIHGTNAPETIGQRVSSGCIRLTNEDIIDLFNRTSVGAKVVVIADSYYRSAAVPPQPRMAAPLRERVPHVAQPTIETPRPVANVPDDNRTLMFGSSASRLY
jgi:lipoprotein-anchoring transpeptidase ErfK/SrfK